MTMELGVTEIENGSNEIGKDDLQREVKMLRRENHALKLEIEALKQEQDVFTIGSKRVKLTNGGYNNHQSKDHVDSREDSAARVEKVALEIPRGTHTIGNGVQSSENGDATLRRETLGLDLLSFTFDGVESDPDKPVDMPLRLSVWGMSNS